ncbi:MAG TPA: iron-sulfur cluster assembly accessory protein [Chloroflexota bacterium]|nr:iron-sulfur cluster assembly accessory protein [Chloroflexota bacterium]
MNVTVLPKASDELRKAVDERRQQNATDTIRVMVQSQCGCGKAHFAMGFDQPAEGDNQIDVNGVTLLIDPGSAPFLENAEIDYSDELMGRGFQIHTANGGGCGCGGGGHHH